MRHILAIVALAVICTGCHRSSREVWEDTKTASRYMGKGMRSLMGRHTDASNYAFYDNWEEETGGEYSPMADNDRYGGLGSMSDMEGTIPISRESPGDPGSVIPGIDGFASPSGELARLFDNIHFATDQYTVAGHENLETLEKIANYMVKHQGAYVFVEGHADERGAAAYNLALGSRRANSVRSFLIQNGVNPDQLFTISYGKERPLVMEHGEGSWSKNRRAQFKIYEK